MSALSAKDFLTKHDIQCLLKNDFAKAVKEKRYKRIEYPIWRTLMNHHDDMTLVGDEQHQCWCIEYKDDGVWHFEYFPIDDGSFGTFLLDYFLNIDISEPLCICNTNKEDTDINATTLSDALTNIRSATSAFDNLSNTLSWTTTGTGTSIDWVNPYLSSTTTASTWETTINNIPVEDFCRKSECPLNKKKEKKENPMNFGNTFNFGPCTNDNVRMSLYGLAVKNNAGSWVSYNKESKQIIDVDILNFDGRKFLFKMPVAIDKIAVGDIVIHGRVPMFVTEIKDGNITAVDAVAGEMKTIIPTTNMFGFNFVTKIVSLVDVYSTAPTADQPFGNLLPFFMMNGDGNLDSNTLLMLAMMNGGQNTFDLSNPLMLYCMMKDGGSANELLPLMLLTQKK